MTVQKELVHEATQPRSGCSKLSLWIVVLFGVLAYLLYLNHDRCLEIGAKRFSRSLSQSCFEQLCKRAEDSEHSLECLLRTTQFGVRRRDRQFRSVFGKRRFSKNCELILDSLKHGSIDSIQALKLICLATGSDSDSDVDSLPAEDRLFFLNSLSKFEGSLPDVYTNAEAGLVAGLALELVDLSLKTKLNVNERHWADLDSNLMRCSLYSKEVPELSKRDAQTIQQIWSAANQNDKGQARKLARSIKFLYRVKGRRFANFLISKDLLLLRTGAKHRGLKEFTEEDLQLLLSQIYVIEHCQHLSKSSRLEFSESIELIERDALSRLVGLVEFSGESDWRFVSALCAFHSGREIILETILREPNEKFKDLHFTIIYYTIRLARFSSTAETALANRLITLSLTNFDKTATPEKKAHLKNSLIGFSRLPKENSKLRNDLLAQFD